MSQKLRTWIAAAGYALAYLVAAWLGAATSFGGLPTPALSPQTGVALALFLIAGRGCCPGLLAGGILFNVLHCMNAGLGFWPVLFAGTIAGVGDVAGAFLGAWLTARFASGLAAFEETKAVLRFVALAALLGTAFGTVLILPCILGTHLRGTTNPGEIWLVRWLASAVGVLLVVPTVVVWSRWRPRMPSRTKLVEVTLLLVLLFLLVFIVFSEWLVSTKGIPIAFLSAIVPVWAAFRFGQRGATAVVLLLGIMGAAGTLQGQGPFVFGEHSAPVLLLQTFLGVTSVLALSIAAGVQQKKLMDQNLTSSERRYRTLFENNPLPMWVFESQTFRFLAVNRAAIDHYGYSRDEFLAMSFADIQPPEETTVLRAEVGRRPSGKLDRQWMHRKKDGTLIQVEVVAHEVSFAEHEAVMVLCLDVTERNRAEKKSRAYSVLGQRLSAARTTKETALILADTADELFTWDACVLDLYTGHPPRLENILCVDTVDGKKRDFELEVNETGEIGRLVLDEGRQFLLDEKPRRTASFGNTSRRSASLMFVPIRRDNQIMGLFSIQSYRPKAYSQDDLQTLQTLVDHCTAALERIRAEASLEAQLAERRRAEHEVLRLNVELEQRVRDRTAQLEAINKELESFAYSVSHDLRAPLRSIRGFSEVLLERYGRQFDPRGREFLRRTCDSSHQMDRLIEDLLKLSRVSRSELHRLPVNLSALAENIISELRKSEPERQVEFVVTPDVTGEGDERLLRIVLDNLLRNAWKFTAKTPNPRIEFGLSSDPQPAFFVRDNGAGFDVSYASKLFGVFQRLHNANEFPGTGVGLATVQRIINRHGGRVWAVGEVNRGATFYFTLPAYANV